VMDRKKARQDLAKAIAKVRADAEYDDLEWLASLLEEYRRVMVSEADVMRKRVKYGQGQGA